MVLENKFYPIVRNCVQELHEQTPYHCTSMRWRTNLGMSPAALNGKNIGIGVLVTAGVLGIYLRTQVHQHVPPKIPTNREHIKYPTTPAEHTSQCLPITQNYNDLP